MSFKDDINKAEIKKLEIFNLIMCFSNEMKKLMGLDTEDLRKAEYLEIRWRIRGFVIGARSFAWTKWIPILVAIPEGLELSHVGYTNYFITLPAKWHYNQKGTDTEILPPQEVRNIILDRIKEVTENKSEKSPAK